jgi:PQQ-like domain
MRPYIFLSLIHLGMLGCGKDSQPNILKSPETLWKTALTPGEETLSVDPILYKDLVIYSANDSGNISKSKLIAFHKETGKRVWEWVNQNESSGRIRGCDSYVHNNILIVPILGRPYQIVAINLDNGAQLWHQTPPEAVSWQLVGSDHFVFYIRGNLDRMKDEIFVADVNTGNWQSIHTASNVNAPVYIRGVHTYTASDRQKYLTFLVAKYKDFQFSETESTIFKYSIDSNKMVSQKTLNFVPKTSSLVLAGVALGKLWLKGDQVLSLDESNLEKHMEFLVPITVSNALGNIAIAENQLLMTTVNKLVCFEAATGKFLWQEEGNTSGSPSRLLYYDHVIYYTSGGDGKFHAMDATTGKTIYNVKSPDEKANGQGIFDRAITLDTINRRIYTASSFSAICYKMP